MATTAFANGEDTSSCASMEQHGKWQFTGSLKLYLIDVWEERHGSLLTVGTAKLKVVLVD